MIFRGQAMRLAQFSIPFRLPGMDARLSLCGMGSLRKIIMFRDSRKAQLNSFAHHRAAMLFTFKAVPRVIGDRPGTESVSHVSLTKQVRAALLGGKSSAATIAS